MLSQSLLVCSRGLSLRGVSKLLSDAALRGGHSTVVARHISLTPSRHISLTPHKYGSGAGMWKTERVVSGALFAVIPAAFFLPSPMMDYAAALVVWAHCHWGLETVVTDYMRTRVHGALIAKASLYAFYVFSVLSMGSLFYFTYSDVGVVGAAKMLWKL